MSAAAPVAAVRRARGPCRMMSSPAVATVVAAPASAPRRTVAAFPEKYSDAVAAFPEVLVGERKAVAALSNERRAVAAFPEAFPDWAKSAAEATGTTPEEVLQRLFSPNEPVIPTWVLAAAEATGKTPEQVMDNLGVGNSSTSSKLACGPSRSVLPVKSVPVASTRPKVSPANISPSTGGSWLAPVAGQTIPAGVVGKEAIGCLVTASAAGGPSLTTKSAVRLATGPADRCQVALPRAAPTIGSSVVAQTTVDALPGKPTTVNTLLGRSSSIAAARGRSAGRTCVPATASSARFPTAGSSITFQPGVDSSAVAPPTCVAGLPTGTAMGGGNELDAILSKFNLANCTSPSVVRLPVGGSSAAVPTVVAGATSKPTGSSSIATIVGPSASNTRIAATPSVGRLQPSGSSAVVSAALTNGVPSGSDSLRGGSSTVPVGGARSLSPLCKALLSARHHTGSSSVTVLSELPCATTTPVAMGGGLSSSSSVPPLLLGRFHARVPTGGLSTTAPVRTPSVGSASSRCCTPRPVDDLPGVPSPGVSSVSSVLRLPIACASATSPRESATVAQVVCPTTDSLLSASCSAAAAGLRCISRAHVAATTSAVRLPGGSASCTFPVAMPSVPTTASIQRSGSATLPVGPGRPISIGRIHGGAAVRSGSATVPVGPSSQSRAGATISCAIQGTAASEVPGVTVGSNRSQSTTVSFIRQKSSETPRLRPGGLSGTCGVATKVAVPIGSTCSPVRKMPADEPVLLARDKSLSPRQTVMQVIRQTSLSPAGIALTREHAARREQIVQADRKSLEERYASLVALQQQQSFPTSMNGAGHRPHGLLQKQAGVVVARSGYLTTCIGTFPTPREEANSSSSEKDVNGSFADGSSADAEASERPKIERYISASEALLRLPPFVQDPKCAGADGKCR